MKIQTFLEVVSDGEGGYLRTAAENLFELMQAEDFTAFCEELRRVHAAMATPYKAHSFNAQWDYRTQVLWILDKYGACTRNKISALLACQHKPSAYETGATIVSICNTPVEVPRYLYCAVKIAITDMKRDKAIKVQEVTGIAEDGETYKFTQYSI